MTQLPKSETTTLPKYKECLKCLDVSIEIEGLCLDIQTHEKFREKAFLLDKLNKMLLVVDKGTPFENE